MNKPLNVGLSLAAGLLGGFISHYISPGIVHAQAQAAPPAEIRAQRFVLTNDAGTPRGFLGFNLDGKADLVLQDSTGKVIWSATGRKKAEPLAVGTAK